MMSHVYRSLPSCSSSKTCVLASAQLDVSLSFQGRGKATRERLLRRMSEAGIVEGLPRIQNDSG